MMLNPRNMGQAKRKRQHSNGPLSFQAPISFDLVELCDAAARITKMLLGLGAENNWEDIQESHGRAMMAGMYRSNWLYLSRNDRGEHTELPKLEKTSNWLETFLSGRPLLLHTQN